MRSLITAPSFYLPAKFKIQGFCAVIPSVSTPVYVMPKDNDNYYFARIATRIGIVMVLLIATSISFNFCWSVYFDRYTVYNSALACTIGILNANHATYWLQNATLLGATRIGKLILWETDLRFGIARTPKNDYIYKALHESCFPKTLYSDASTLPTWHMCNSRICATFDEAEIKNGFVITKAGNSSVSYLLPLAHCNLMDTKSFCPANSTFYLQSSFGANWLSSSFMDLFRHNYSS